MVSKWALLSLFIPYPPYYVVLLCVIRIGVCRSVSRNRRAGGRQGEGGSPLCLVQLFKSYTVCLVGDPSDQFFGFLSRKRLVFLPTTFSPPTVLPSPRGPPHIESHAAHSECDRKGSRFTPGRLASSGSINTPMFL